MPCVQALRGKPITNFKRWHTQQWAHKLNTITLPACWHARQTWQPCSTAECQQQRFNLVIRMLGNRYGFNSCLRPTLLG
jgi:hypothetical protein